MTQYCAEYRYCRDCRGERPFELFHAGDCPDVADGECPEHVCAGCGSVLIIGLVVPGYSTGDTVSKAA